ncbi:glycosyltransferase family 2 protein [Aequorivita todarodis]|uniref:glycosyltransferase family 2 protein n=1 Tax=Aequorivita todarodis TaxID=2036821 RepID=UPI002350313A|nr:glycosyltransferase family 2 protein [Aequorivita todarodis]MDC8000100.1 glycosyltransferase family 2 protein [Aequorivita todarodis]
MPTDTPLVSIIIPTFNRAHLIGETLASILAQTYQNWECIVIDDGSTDNTEEVMAGYMARDSRFRYYSRPAHKVKGANSCRNIGLNLVMGEFIVFFDSDDIMISDHLKVKISEILLHDCDYVITKTEFIGSEKKVGKNNYRFHLYPLTSYNYVSQAINWLTYDVCIKKNVAQSIQFNEDLHSGQEYNYFSKLVHKSINAKFIDKTVTLRRYHKDTIRGNLNTSQKLLESSFRAKWFTYCDLMEIADQETRLVLLNKCISLIYQNKRIWNSNNRSFTMAIFKEYGGRGIYFLLMLLNLRLFGKGYFFYKKLTS